MRASFVHVTALVGRRALSVVCLLGAHLRASDQLGGAGDVAGDPAALAAPEGYLRSWRQVGLIRRTLDRACTRRTAERGATAVGRDEVKSLGGVVLRGAGLTHRASIYSENGLRVGSRN